MLSVIVPVYNSKDFLKNCIESIINQTYKDIEILCIDDGSIDESGRILDELSKMDYRIKVIHQKNSGVSHARNVGLKQSKGEWITFIDSDDDIDLNMYMQMIELLQKTSADIVHCGYRKIHFDESVDDIRGTGIILEQNSADACRCLIEGIYFAGGIWNKIYDRKLIEGLEFNETLKINEDILFNFEAFRRATKIVFWDKPFYHYYERQTSACINTASLKKTYDCAKVAKIIMEKSYGEDYLQSSQLKYFSCIVNAYRVLLYGEGSCKDKQIVKKEIYKMKKKIKKIPWKYQMNNFFMLHFPWLYRNLYIVYDRLRKPNWDIQKR